MGRRTSLRVRVVRFVAVRHEQRMLGLEAQFDLPTRPLRCFAMINSVRSGSGDVSLCSKHRDTKNVTISASCSIAPESLRSESSGRFVGSRFDGTVQLGQGDDRDAEVFGGRFERAADVGEFFVAIDLARERRRPHQLKVVDEYGGEPVRALEPAQAAADFGDRNGTGVVEIDGQFMQHAHRVADLLPVAVGDRAAAELGGVEPSFRRQQTLDQLCLVISSEKTAMGFFSSLAAATAMLSASDVLPIAGRAATMIKLPGCQPAV